MRGLLVAIAVLSGTTPAQDAPRRLQLELHWLRQQHEEVSVALPVTLAAVGAGALVTGLLFDAATASARPVGAPSVLAVGCYLVSSFLLMPGAMTLLGRWVQRGLLGAHIRDVEWELAYAR